MEPVQSWKPFKVETEENKELEESTVLALKVEERAVSQGCRQPLCTRNTRGEILAGASRT